MSLVVTTKYILPALTVKKEIQQIQTFGAMVTVALMTLKIDANKEVTPCCISYSLLHYIFYSVKL